MLLSLLGFLWAPGTPALAEDELSNETKLKLLNCLIEKQQKVIDQISTEISTGTYGALDLTNFLATADTIGKGGRSAAYKALPPYLQYFIDKIENDRTNNLKDAAEFGTLHGYAKIDTYRWQIEYAIEKRRSQRLVELLQAEKAKLGQIQPVPPVRFEIAPVTADISSEKKILFSSRDNIYFPKQVQYKWFINDQLVSSTSSFELDGNKYAVTQPSKLSLNLWVFDPTQVDSCTCTLIKPKWTLLGTQNASLHWKQPMKTPPAQKPSSPIPTNYRPLEIHYPPAN